MKPITIAVVALFALATLGATFFMPWAELILSPQAGNAPQVVLNFAQSLGLKEMLTQVATGVLKLKLDPNYEYYVYSFFVGLALVAAAIAINAVGRLDSEEKTVIPSK